MVANAIIAVITEAAKRGWLAISHKGRGGSGGLVAVVSAAGAGSRIGGKRMNDMMVKTTTWTTTIDA
jgi:hypothetical protein